jgi:hypothetical protein
VLPDGTHGDDPMEHLAVLAEASGRDLLVTQLAWFLQ